MRKTVISGFCFMVLLVSGGMAEEKNPVLEYRGVRMDLLTSKDVQDYMAKNDMVILPVGCFEMHGPLIPLGCDFFNAWGKSLILAREWNCLTLPPVMFTFPGASGPWPGTTDISMEATQNYIADIVRSLFQNGFKRVVIVGSHGPLSSIMECVLRGIFQKTGQIALFIQPQLFPDEKLEGLGYPGGEDIGTLASLKLLGWHGAYNPACTAEVKGRMPFQSVSRLKGEMQATLPWTFSHDYEHTGLRKEVKMEHADQAIAIMEKAAHQRYGELPALFAQYQKDMEKLYKEKPWTRKNIWTPVK